MTENKPDGIGLGDIVRLDDKTKGIFKECYKKWIESDESEV